MDTSFTKTATGLDQRSSQFRDGLPIKIEIQLRQLEDNAIKSGWLNTFSRSALGLVRELTAIVQGPEIRNAVHKLIELEVAEHYWEKRREVIFVPVGNFKWFDGISQSKQLCFEVKFEQRAAETFNLCFEYWCKGQPSGLATTQAGKWVHVVPLDQTRFCCYEFDVERLRETLRDFPTFKGGDRGQSVVKLLPMSKAEELKSDKFTIEIDWNKIKPYW